MPLDRRALKERSVFFIRSSDAGIVRVSSLYLLFTILIAVLSTNLVGIKLTETDAARYMEYFEEGNYEYALAILQSIQPPPRSYLFNALLLLISEIVGIGYISYLLNAVRLRPASIGNLMDGFTYGLKSVALLVLEFICISLAAILLIVPGVILYYRWSMAVYLLADDPTRSPIECLRESALMMHGNKWELFQLDLSFLGWAIAGILPVIGYAVRVWTTPYIGVTKVLYYERLLGKDVFSDQPITE